jgi:dTDP-4-dehydrorhamnose reductase
MAGHVMAEYLAQKPEYEIIRCARNVSIPSTIILDVTDFQKVENIMRAKRPDVVVNCIGMLVQASQDRVDQAILINSFLPHFLSRLGRELDFKMIHISTDCVFSGKRGGYSEDDFRDGDNPYARTKALGEVVNNVDLTLRTSFIGPELKQDGTGLLHWFLMQKGTIKGFSKAYWSGVTTLELAKVVELCIRHGLSGLVNLTMAAKISKFDLLVACQKVWSHEQIRILPDDTYTSDKSMVSCRTDLPFSLPANYLAMLNELRNFINQHQCWYSHYFK